MEKENEIQTANEVKVCSLNPSDSVDTSAHYSFAFTKVIELIQNVKPFWLASPSTTIWKLMLKPMLNISYWLIFASS